MRNDSGMGPAPLQGSCERGKLPSPWEAPSPVRRSAGTEGELQKMILTNINVPCNSTNIVICLCYGFTHLNNIASIEILYVAL